MTNFLATARDVAPIAVAVVLIAAAAWAACSAPFWGAQASRWERARQRRQQARRDTELARMVAAGEREIEAAADCIIFDTVERWRRDTRANDIATEVRAAFMAQMPTPIDDEAERLRAALEDDDALAAWVGRGWSA